ncbi:MAG: phosphotransferase family protein [Nitriliruptoraceae bacterium]|nr:phosphotransferase family protein [Nitriliruptoraceae bacterium]
MAATADDEVAGEVPGVDPDAVTRWIAERTPLEPPCTFALVEGGRSNLTYTVTDAAGQRLILRRPPLHGVIASAHDMGREHRILEALADSAVPVPRCVGYEPDEAVTGASFYVMHFVDGAIVRTDAEASALTPAQRAAASDAVVDTLVALHEVDIDAVGLGELARREGYIERQLRRWHGQLEKTRTRPLPLLDEVHARLVADIPAQGPATIVHGDYRLDNLILTPDGSQVAAVLDWELTTLGDPLADLGLLCVYWSEPDDELVALPGAPTVVEGFRSRDELLARYAQRSGRDVGQVAYHVAFGYWKLACILEGVYSRTASGAYGEVDEGVEAFGQLVVALGAAADRAAREVGR